MSFETQYRRIRDGHADVLPPGDVAALLEFLHDPGSLSEPKNAALRALVQAGQDKCAASECATTAVLLALWPGLDAVRSRLRRTFPQSHDILDADLVGRLTVAIGGCDLTRVNRVAATLLRNVEHDTSRALVRADREVTTQLLLEDCIDHMPIAPLFAAGEIGEQTDTRMLRKTLRDRIDNDAHLVLLVIVGGCTQGEAADLLGLSHGTARKRFQRAITRLQKLVPDCPIPDRRLAFDSHRKSDREANR